MIGKLQKRIASAAAAALAVLAGATSAGAVCVGDCNSDHQVLVNEVVASVNVFQETSPLSSCMNADQNGDGKVFINEVVGAVNSFLGDESTCQMVAGPTLTPTSQGPALTNTPTRTNTPPPTNTPTRTFTPVPTNTPTQQPTNTPTQQPTNTATPPGEAVCGDGVVQTAVGEQCDDGGICTGGDNAGTACMSESQCTGNGVCVSGTKLETACANDAGCPGGKCIKCKPFGGDGCAANCTTEKTITYSLKPGELVKRCTAGVNQNAACTVDADCPASKCQTGGCLGGTNDGGRCTATAQCPGGRCIPQVLNQTTTGAFVHDGILQLALPISGQQSLTIGGIRDGMITGVIKAATSTLPRIKVGSLACACVRAIPVKTCGGTLFNEDGTTTTTCTPNFTAGESLCVGKKPCAFVHGPGNATTAFIGCNGLVGTDLLFTQDAGMKPGDVPPPAPTPQPNSKPPILILSGSGGPGSAILLNSSAIGTTVNGTNVADKCVGTHPDFGPDGNFCTDDDPQSTRGAPSTLPQVTGTATGEIFNTVSSTQSDLNIGPFSYTGSPYNCADLTAPFPSAAGAKVAGAFAALNQPATGDIVVRNIFVVQ